MSEVNPRMQTAKPASMSLLPGARHQALHVLMLVCCLACGVPPSPATPRAQPAPARPAAPDEPAPRDRDYPWMSLASWQERRRALHDIPAEKRRQAELVIVGDSIVEGFDQAVFEQFFGRYHALKLGIGGDKTQQVLWRIEQGELDGLSPRVLVLLIGTNNIGADGATTDDVARGVARVVERMRQRLPQTKILLLGILPREQQASAAVRREVAAINQKIAALADGQSVRYEDVGARFLAPDGSISQEVMGDFLHPTAGGYRIFAEALAPVVDEMVRK
jgi:lysophospholipase L1-like esterase